MDGHQREQAAADAVVDISSRAMSYARRYGQPNPDPVARIYDNATIRQARSLLTDALVKLYGLDRRDYVKILHALRNLDGGPVDHHAARAEQWRMIERVAAEYADEEEFYGGDDE